MNTAKKLSFIVYSLLLFIFPLLYPAAVLALPVNHLVISEVQTKGVVADDEFIELFNPTSNPINLSTLPLKLHIINSTGTDQNRALTFINNTIPAYGYFLIGPASGYTGTIPLDATYSSSGNKLVDDGAVYISTSVSIDKTGLIDLVGFGAASLVNREGVAIGNPAVSTSVERKATSASTVLTLAAGGKEADDGNGEDTSNNSADFVLQNTSNPQNSLSAKEYPSLINNGSFESVSQGSPYLWQKRQALLTDSTVACLGNSSIKLTGSGNAPQVYTFQYAQLKPNTKYTLSAWVKTNNVLGKGVSLRYAQLKPQTMVVDSGYWLNGTSDWKKIEKIFTTPSNYVSGRIDILWEMLPGDIAWVDDVKVKETPNAVQAISPVGALVDNPSFESSYFSNNTAYPTRWWQRPTATFDSSNFHTGLGSMKVTGPQTGSAVVYSFQEVILEPNSQYQLSAWVKTNNVLGKGVSLRYAQLYPGVKVFPTGSVRGNSDWQQVSATFTTPNSYNSGRLDLLWDFQSGDVGWIDDVSLIKL